MSDATKDIHVTVVVGEDGSVRVDRLPFRAGQAVDVTIHPVSSVPSAPSAGRYPLAGVPVEYVDPFRGVAEGEWESSR